MRFHRVSLALLAVLTFSVFGALASPAHADIDGGAEASFIGETNALRASRGLPGLVVHGTLVAKARGWAQHLSGTGTIFHSNLPDGAPNEWVRLGENVGKGPSVASIHAALVASPTHLANLLDPGFRYVGVGVVNANGTLYVSEVFMETASQPATMPSATAGTPPSPRPIQPVSQVRPAAVPVAAAPMPVAAPMPAPVEPRRFFSQGAYRLV